MLFSVGPSTIEVNNPEQALLISLAGVLQTLLEGHIYLEEEIARWQSQGGPVINDVVRAYPRTNDGLTGKCLEYAIAVGLQNRRPAHLIEAVGRAIDALGLSLAHLVDVQPWGVDKRSPERRQLSFVHRYGAKIYYWKKDARGRPVTVDNALLLTTQYQGLGKADLIFIFRPTTEIMAEGWFVACSVKEHKGLFNPSEEVAGIHFGLCLDNAPLIDWGGPFPVFGIRRIFGLGEALYSINEDLMRKFAVTDFSERTVKNDKIFPAPLIRSLAQYLFSNRLTPVSEVISNLLVRSGRDDSILTDMISKELNIKPAIANSPPLIIRLT